MIRCGKKEEAVDSDANTGPMAVRSKQETALGCQTNVGNIITHVQARHTPVNTKTRTQKDKTNPDEQRPSGRKANKEGREGEVEHTKHIKDTYRCMKETASAPRRADAKLETRHTGMKREPANPAERTQGQKQDTGKEEVKQAQTWCEDTWHSIPFADKQYTQAVH